MITPSPFEHLHMFEFPITRYTNTRCPLSGVRGHRKAKPGTSWQTQSILRKWLVLGVSSPISGRSHEHNILTMITGDFIRTLLPIGSMVLLYMVTFTINIPPMLAYIAYMDPMGYKKHGYDEPRFPRSVDDASAVIVPYVPCFSQGQLYFQVPSMQLGSHPAGQQEFLDALQAWDIRKGLLSFCRTKRQTQNKFP